MHALLERFPYNFIRIRYLDAHIMKGYTFLMQNYRAGDKICLFGMYNLEFESCMLDWPIIY